ncbi:MAG: FtsW/RodA/SpoVE family cell cycle protein [Ignavibacteria bacterium]|nr:FtsW/RodA/SpoVE family cell cycle protein [Ignavibacteria bacterium]
MKLLKLEYLQVVLYVLVLILMILSLALVYSASVRYSELMGDKKDSHELAMKHTAKTVVAVVFLFIAARLPIKFWKDFTHFFLIFSIFLLVAVFIIGEKKKGAYRWIDLKLFELQPSFVALYAMIFHFARLIEKKGERIRDFKTGYLPMLTWIGVIATLVFLQPNFSQGSIIIFVGLSMIFLGGAQIKHLVSTVLASLPFVLVYLFSAEYRYQRIMIYIQRLLGKNVVDPDPQVRYSIYAIGSGGILGVGFGNSRFRELFIPESYGDFIFAIIGEELGFVGSVIILSLYLGIFIVSFFIVLKLKDMFSKLVVSGVVIVLMFYVFANTLVVVGLLPNTGLPLPFISYGGSATVMHAIGIGVVINIASQIKSEPQVQSNFLSVRNNFYEV